MDEAVTEVTEVTKVTEVIKLVDMDVDEVIMLIGAAALLVILL